MMLKKAMAGYWKPVNKIIQNEDGSVSHVNGSEWVEQKEIEMHPLEEASIRAHWAIHDELIKCPPKPTPQEEHEWLIVNGLDYVKQKRNEWQKAYDENKPLVDEANRKFQEAHKAWCDHCGLCCANGFNPDEFEGDAREKLKMPVKGENDAAKEIVE